MVGTHFGAVNAGDRRAKMEIYMIRNCVICSLVVLLAGCATSFTGSPHVENGRSGCESKCKGQGMEVAGMVYMGEYSSACVCEVPGQHASRRRILLGSSGAVAGGVAGVEMQRQQEQRNRHQGY